ncbi:hypothetical protein Q6284_32135, partial [Klebsiella pneumoniae]|nr:hypothetical protein [Klebsiella pneumoniae]
MFWMLSRNIDRLRAEEDVRNLHPAQDAAMSQPLPN